MLGIIFGMILYFLRFVLMVSLGDVSLEKKHFSIFEHCHSSEYGSHFGTQKTIAKKFCIQILLAYYF